MNPNDITYKKATQELETILRAIENDTVDVDELTQKVLRSSELIKICKQKLRSAESAINEVFQDIDCDTPEPVSPDAPAGEQNRFVSPADEVDADLPF